MIILQGKGVSGGIARGCLLFCKKGSGTVLREDGEGSERENSRFASAQKLSIEQLEKLAEKCRREIGEDEAVLFETHAMLALDDDYVSCIYDTIEKDGCRAEYAVHLAGEKFSSLFSSMDDVYMRERAADIRDVTRRIIENLGAESDDEGTYRSRGDGQFIVAADDLAPSETVQLDKSKILGFVTKYGSSNSHTAILARTMGIPAVCAVGDKLGEIYDGQFAYIDGETGEIVIDPDEVTRRTLDEKYERIKETEEHFRSMIGKEDITLDGKRMMLYCNISSPDDIHAVLANDGQGIGLFRSEFLYLAADDYPTEEEQLEAYRSAASAMNGKRVIIRTLDIGADKQVDYFNLKKEENPAMGLRAVRICLNRPDVFRTQLRALYRASAYGKIAIMFPMITSVWEVKECRRACVSVMQELREEGIPFDSECEIGIMIETPASVLIAEELAEHVDFFSVGTNDLTQYTLACDRQTGDLGKFFDPYHPAVLRALKIAADAAHKKGIWIGICGELGSDLSLLPTFLAIGIDELSVPPSSILPLRAELRQTIAKTCELDLLET
ncbi:MAG: phosphoenolpyruvate--protein phosphotransferase [Ruminococcaceae bacterium]|nr:phosphoenolpyruvate--protein phosphotransferase [Oscillospiraceae bacterium]